MQTMKDKDTLLSTADVAKELNISSVTVQKLLNKGELRGIRIGSKIWRVRKSDLEEYVKRNTNIEQEKS